MLFKKVFIRVFFTFAFVASVPLSSMALEISNTSIKSKVGQPISLDFYIDKDKGYKVTEADKNTYKMFNAHKDSYNENIAIIKDSLIKNLFHIKGKATFDGTVFDIILKFSKSNDVNFFKRITKDMLVYDHLKEEAIVLKKVNEDKALAHNKVAQKHDGAHQLNGHHGTSNKNDENSYVVKRGNTLYGISLKRASNINRDAVIVSSWIFESNKKAFVNKNPNIIKSYVTIKLPSEADMKSYDIQYSNRGIARNVLRFGNRSQHKLAKVKEYKIKIRGVKSHKKRASTKEMKLVTPSSPEESDAVVKVKEASKNSSLNKADSYNEEKSITDLAFKLQYLEAFNKKMISKVEILKIEIKRMSNIVNKRKIVDKGFDMSLIASLFVNFVFFAGFVYAIILLKRK